MEHTFCPIAAHYGCPKRRGLRRASGALHLEFAHPKSLSFQPSVPPILLGILNPHNRPEERLRALARPAATAAVQQSHGDSLLAGILLRACDRCRWLARPIAL
jgi:hypothetical protein